MPTNRDISSDIDDVNTPIPNRLNATINVQNVVIRRLGQIHDVLRPDGPPSQPEIQDALATVIARANMQILIAKKILDPATPGDIPIP
jgi:hypothetical protein